MPKRKGSVKETKPFLSYYIVTPDNVNTITAAFKREIAQTTIIAFFDAAFINGHLTIYLSKAALNQPQAVPKMRSPASPRPGQM